MYNPGDIAWVLASTALVWIMIPGVGFFYSGLLRRKNALSMIWASMMTLAVVSFQVSLGLLWYDVEASRLTTNTFIVVLLGVTTLARMHYVGFSDSTPFHRFSLTFSDTADKYIGDLSE